MRKPSLLLAGYGRFGAFAAGFLKRRFDVHVLERRRGVKLAAGLKRASAGDIGRFDILILAMPAGAVERFLRVNSRRIRPGSFVADVCAVKSAPIVWMEMFLPPGVSYAGLHPLFGPASAAGGPSGHRVAVCRGRSTASCHRRLLSTIRAFGMEPVETDPVIHDRTMASTLFLTEIIGDALPRPEAPARPALETPAFRHLDRVRATAGGNSPALIKELITYNPFCSRMLVRLKGRFSGKFEHLTKISRIH